MQDKTDQQALIEQLQKDLAQANSQLILKEWIIDGYVKALDSCLDNKKALADEVAASKRSIALYIQMHNHNISEKCEADGREESARLAAMAYRKMLVALIIANVAYAVFQYFN